MAAALVDAVSDVGCDVTSGLCQPSGVEVEPQIILKYDSETPIYAIMLGIRTFRSEIALPSPNMSVSSSSDPDIATHHLQHSMLLLQD